MSTGRVGCGQWLVSQGSPEFVCYIASSDLCVGTDPSASTLFLGASMRPCDAATATLPSLASLLAETPQVLLFVEALRVAAVSSFPGSQITVFAPTNAAMATDVPAADLTSPPAMRVLVLQSLASGALGGSELLAAGQVRMASGDTYPVTQIAGSDGEAPFAGWGGGGGRGVRRGGCHEEGPGVPLVALASRKACKEKLRAQPPSRRTLQATPRWRSGAEGLCWQTCTPPTACFTWWRPP